MLSGLEGKQWVTVFISRKTGPHLGFLHVSIYQDGVSPDPVNVSMPRNGVDGDPVSAFIHFGVGDPVKLVSSCSEKDSGRTRTSCALLSNLTQPQPSLRRGDGRERQKGLTPSTLQIEEQEGSQLPVLVQSPLGHQEPLSIPPRPDYRTAIGASPLGAPALPPWCRGEEF